MERSQASGFMDRIKGFSFKKHVWYNYKLVTVIGVIFLLIACLRRISHGDPGNNFMIFANSSDHFLAQMNLYALYPEEYFDRYLYGPLFALLITPISLLPRLPGVIIWLILSTLTAWYIGRRGLIDFPKEQRTVFLWIIVNEIYLALLMQQYNILVACFMILALLYAEREKHVAGTFFIALGTLTKIYGGIGFLLFPFVRDKKKFILWSVIWMLFLGVLPALFSSPAYLRDQYLTWFDTLSAKDTLNIGEHALKQNMGFVGLVRRATGNPHYSDLWLMVPGLLLLLAPLLRFDQYKYKSFRYLFYASAMLFVVLFSTGTESNTYIVGYMGIALWWIITCGKKNMPNWFDITIFVGALIFSHCTGDLFPRAFRENYVTPYSLKSIFPMLIWVRIVYILLKDDHTGYHITNVQSERRMD